MATKPLELSIQITGKLDKSLTAALNGADSKIKGFANGLSKVGTAGLAAMGTLATGTVAAIASCTNAAEDFEKSMSSVTRYVSGLADAQGKVSNKIYEGNSKTFVENYGAMEKALLDLSTQVPITADQLAEMAAAAGQSGKSINDLIQYDSNGNIKGFLVDVAQMATAMDITADQAGAWAAKWEQSFSMNHDEVMTLTDQINYLGANSATTAAEIAQVVNDTASLGQVAGLNTATTAALADAELAMGVDSGVAATAIRRMIVQMSLGSSATKAQQETWQKLGMTATDVAKGMQTDSVETMKSVFTALNQLPDYEKIAALKNIFGQWSIEGAAKMTGNLEPFIKAMDMVSDPSKFQGSMQREFIINASTTSSLNTMMSNAFTALKVDLGDEFLPVKKQFDLMIIDTLNGIREHAPELKQLGSTLAGILAKGVDKLGAALDTALPYIQQALDYVANNGPQVADTLKTMAVVFAGMKFAPGIADLIGLGQNLMVGKPGAFGKRNGGLLGTVSGLWKGGQSFSKNAINGINENLGFAKQGIELANNPILTGFQKGNIFSNANNNLIGAILGIQNKGILSGKGRSYKAWQSGFEGLLGQITTARENGGVFSIFGNMLGKTKLGGYFGNIGNSIGALGNTKIGGGLLNAGKGTFNVTKEILAGIAGPQGLGITQIPGFVGTLGQIIGEDIANSGFGQAVGGALGKAGAFGGAALGKVGSFGGKALSLGGSALGAIGQFGGGLFNVGSSVLGPLVGAFGSIVSGAAPVVLAISGIIAVVSILGDHLQDIRGIVGNVFGPTGLKVFDTFTAKLSEIGNFISGLFVDGGVANALAPLQDLITGKFGAGAGAAFGGVVQILQSVMGIVGQIVTFATGTVKPIIVEIFGYITQTVLPILMNAFTTAAPYISAIITNIGTGVMTVFQYIGQAVQAALPYIETVITTMLKIGSIVVPAILSGWATLTSSIVPIIDAIKGVFEGLITFITGVFTGNWSQAWQGVRDIFSSAFQGLSELIKAPINAVVAVINGVVSKINGLSIKIPDWVPELGGKTFGVHIPALPKLATGGFTNGVSIAGEAGREAVISFLPRVRDANITTWQQAGQMLGVNGQQALAAIGSNERTLYPIGGGNETQLQYIDTGNGGSGQANITFAPQITIQGNADRNVMNEAIAEMRSKFEQWYDQMEHRRVRTAY